MNRLSIAGLAFSLLLTPAMARAECGYDRFSVNGSAAEIADACRALAEVKAYFKDIGFDFEPRATLKFSDQVFIAGYDRETKEPTGRFRVSGYFDSGRRIIEVTRGDSKHREDRQPWKLRWSADIAYSILQHEISHMAVFEILGARYPRLSKTWLEYIACAVQFDLMNGELKSRILSGYPELRPFEFPEHVNPMIQNVDPDAFAVRAHLHTQANGGRAFIARLLRGQVDFTTSELLWVK